MSDKSNIEWTDATWNPVRGCDPVSPGCANCYAETFAERFRGVPGHPYEQGFDLRLVPEKLAEPLSWKKPRRVFVNSMSDLFQDGVPDDYIDQVFAVMALAPQHTFQVLTKRAERMREYMTSTADGWGRAARIADAAQRLLGFDGAKYKPMKPPALPSADVFWMGSCNPPDQPYRERWILKTWPLLNVWLGVSVENQHFADERIPLLLQTPAAVRFISAEPLLAPVDLAGLRGGTFDALSGRDFESIGDIRDAGVLSKTVDPPGLDWIICGGESGHGARPFDLAWARSIVAQCQAAGVPVFCKQMGGVPVMDEAEWRGISPTRLLSARNHRRAPVGTVPLELVDRKGGDPQYWPAGDWPREFPDAARS